MGYASPSDSSSLELARSESRSDMRLLSLHSMLRDKAFTDRVHMLMKLLPGVCGGAHVAVHSRLHNHLVEASIPLGAQVEE